MTFIKIYPVYGEWYIDFDKSEEKEGMIKINIDYYFAKHEEIKVYGKEV